MKSVSYGNLIGFFGTIGLLVISRFAAIGESQLPPVLYWTAVVGGTIFMIVGIRFSTIPKWAKAIYVISQIVAICLGISHSNSVHEILFLVALISLLFLFIPIMVWMNHHILSSSTKR